MKTLLITTNSSSNQESFLQSLEAGGLSAELITPCIVRDMPLFISDQAFQLIFIEMDEKVLSESLSLIDQVKMANALAKVVPIIHFKEPDLILQLVKKGIDDVLVCPIPVDDVKALLNSLGGVTTDAAAVATMGGAKIITVTSYKGGTGVSTIVANLAFFMAEHQALQKKTLIVDLANQSNHCALLLGATITLNMNDLAENIAELGISYIASSCSWLTDNLALIGSSTSIDSIIQGFDYDKLVNTLTVLSSSFEYIFIDLPTHCFDSRFLASVQLSHQVVVTSTLDLISISDTKQYIKMLQDLGVEHSKIRLLVNRYDSQSINFNNQDLERAFETPISFYVRNDYFSVMGASQSRVSIMESQPQSMIAEELAEIALGIDSGQAFLPKKPMPKNKKGQSSLFSGLLGAKK